MGEATVLVTGAAGFVGSHLTRRLRSEGLRVVGVDAFRGTTTRALAVERLGSLGTDPGFTLVERDLHATDLTPLVAQTEPAAIFHLAARPGARDTDIAQLERDNVVATERVLAAAATAGVERVVFASSSSVYGDAGAAGPCRETDPVRPLSAYATCKRAAERHCLAAAVDTTIVRLFTVYGPGQRPDMAFQRFITASLTGAAAPAYHHADAARDFTYVADAVDGLVRAWRYGSAPIYNVSGGDVVRLGDAQAMIESLTSAQVPTYAAPAVHEPIATRADLTLAASHLGYEPRTGLRDGLAAQVAAVAAALPHGAAAPASRPG